METEKRDAQLKHLGFVKAAAINVVVCLSNLYDYAKLNAGPLKPAVGAVEGAVSAAVSPVYEKFKNVPDQLLAFLDQQVDVATAKFDEHAPPVAKQAASHVHRLVIGASRAAQELLHQARVGGPSAAAHHAASLSKDFVLTQTVLVYARLDRLPPVHAVARVAVPAAAHWSDKYNKLVTGLTGKGYPVFGYLPLVPVDEIAKAFRTAEPDHPAQE